MFICSDQQLHFPAQLTHENSTETACYWDKIYIIINIIQAKKKIVDVAEALNNRNTIFFFGKLKNFVI